MEATIEAESASISAELKMILQGEPGLSAYEVAVKEGYAGTEAEWVAYLSTNADQAIAAANAAKASEDAAASSAASASTSEAAAAESETSAKTSASAAAASESAAASSSSEASASASAASSSEKAAKASEDAAAESAEKAANVVSTHDADGSAHASGIAGKAATAGIADSAKSCSGRSETAGVADSAKACSGRSETAGSADVASTLQTLQRSAKYEAGELASESSLPFGLVLYCSTAGTTSANAVTI